MAEKRSGDASGNTPSPGWVAPNPSGRHKATVKAIYERPTRADVSWISFAALVAALGGSITNGKGSRRRIVVGTRRANLHEPHPSPNMAKGAVGDARDFLKLLGVSP
jgi:hypothetical protein